MSVVVVTGFFQAPFSAVIDTAADYLKTNPTIAVSPIAVADVGVDVQHKVVDDHTDTVRKHDALQVRWLAPSPLFPSLAALLTVRPHAPGTEVRLSGNYTPPYGLVGKLFDLVVGRLIAALTLRRFLAGVRRHVESDWRSTRR
jgi:hypothetical protein